MFTNVLDKKTVRYQLILYILLDIYLLVAKDRMHSSYSYTVGASYRLGSSVKDFGCLLKSSVFFPKAFEVQLSVYVPRLWN